MSKEKPLLHIWYPVSDEAWRDKTKAFREIPKELRDLTDKLRDSHSVQWIPNSEYRYVMHLTPGVPVTNYGLIKEILESIVKYEEEHGRGKTRTA